MIFNIRGYLDHTGYRLFKTREELDEAIKNKSLVRTLDMSFPYWGIEDEEHVFVFNEVFVDKEPVSSIRVEHRTNLKASAGGSRPKNESEKGIRVWVSACEGWANWEVEVPGEFDASKLYFVGDGDDRILLMYGDIVVVDGREWRAYDMNGYWYDYWFQDESTGEEVSGEITVW